ncbi:MAG TPA: hypothetical protein VGL61_02620 [Kofleriaceae bacterium]|jgi:hypothetical protein
MTNSNNRLDNIATRQRKTRVRDLVFAACVALATVVSITSVSTACDAATPTHVAQR